MTVTETVNGFDHEYSGVVAKAPNSPIYRLIAPDKSTVNTYDYQPKQAELEADLRDAGYTVPEGTMVPFRDMTLGAEVLPGNLSL